MTYLVLSFLKTTDDKYQVFIDKGSGLESHKIEIQGTYFDVLISSPIQFVSEYCRDNGYQILQVAEEDGYNHLRFYLEKTGTAGKS